MHVATTAFKEPMGLTEAFSLLEGHHLHGFLKRRHWLFVA